MADTNSDSPAYTRHFWAKSDRTNPGRIHLLEHHLADVGAVFEALLRQPTIKRRLARCGGLEDLDDVTVARLSVLAALHDIGKVNVGFQTRIWSRSELRGEHRPGWAGHTSDLAPVLLGKDEQTCEWFLDALGWNELLGWDNDDGATFSNLFVASMSHHGEPLDLTRAKPANPPVWRRFRTLRPEDGVRHIGNLIRIWFPTAFTLNSQPLPPAPAFQHMFLGLCTLADWIGSDERNFEYFDEPDEDYISAARRRASRAIAMIGLDISDQRRSFHGLPDFGELFAANFAMKFTPNAIQSSAVEAPLDQPVVIVESETGSGKTEAALWRFAKMYAAGHVDGMYFALPTRAAATQIHRRVNSFVKQMFPHDGGPETVLAVPGYVRAGDFTGKHLPEYRVWWEDHPSDESRTHRWAAESVKRFLAAQIAVGTVDQAMKAALQVRHSHMRAASLARNLLVVDEVHASDQYMRVILQALLDIHIGSGGFALLMSATLGSAARRQLLLRPRRLNAMTLPSLEDAVCTPYPAITTVDAGEESVEATVENNQRKNVRIAAMPAMHEFDIVARLALEAARAGAKTLIIRNTVGHAVETQRAIESAAGPGDLGLLFTCRGIPTLHTSRYAAEDRHLLDQQVESILGRNRDAVGRVVVGTQTLEQSLDIDADLLITDLCPMDVLLQRIGRLHRHGDNNRPAGFQAPLCRVLTPSDDDLSSLLNRTQNANGLGPHGFVYDDLRVLEATRRLVAECSESDSEWTIPEMNRYLVERTTHPERLDAIATEMGDEWRVHADNVRGAVFADGKTARDVLARWDKSFYEDNREVRFAAVEETISTRLGDTGVDVKLDPQPCSPFDPSATISQITVPLRWLRDRAGSDDAVAPVPIDGGFEFEVGQVSFQYDRLGLRRK